MSKFIDELKRRHVIKATIAYVVVAWILIQVASIVLDIFNAPNWINQAFLIILIVGLPIWMVISWIYDITPEGLEITPKASEKQIAKELTNKRLNVLIIVGLSIAVIVLALNQTVFSSTPNKDYSIAIMPFENIQVDEDYNWLSENFTQSVNSYISKVKKLKVIDSHSSSMYKGSDKSNTEIGEELNVLYLFRGHITQFKNKLNITVELIDVISNTVFWSESYDEILEEDALKLQQEVSQKIVDQLKIALTPEDKNALNTALTTNLEASIYFTEGKRIADKRGPGNHDSILPISANLFQKAIDLDPNYADAYAEMAFVIRLISDDHEMFKNTDIFKKVDSLINKALEINPNTALAYTTLGMEQISRYQNYKKAKEYYDKALKIKPNDASLHHYLSLYYNFKPNPNYEKALEHIKIAYRLNPFSAPIVGNVIATLLDDGKISEAEKFYEDNSHVILLKNVIEPQIFEAKAKKMALEKKDWQVYIKIYKQQVEKNPNDSNLYRTLALAYNEILYDNLNFIKYAKKAYELGEKFSENADIDWMSSNGDTYYLALLKTKRFKEAENLLADEYFKSLNAEQTLIYYNVFNLYYQSKYSEAQASLKDFNYPVPLLLSLIYAQQNKVHEVDSIMKKAPFNAYEKAIIFAILQQKDSMYLSIEKEKDIYNILKFNGSGEVDLYRKEERFKAVLRKNYLPITHWNE